MPIGSRIKEVRLSEGLTQNAFGEILGLKRNTVGGYEIGTVAPSDRTLVNICEKFHVQELWLRTGEGNMRNDPGEDEEIKAFMDGILSAESGNFRRSYMLALARLDNAGWDAIEKSARVMLNAIVNPHR